MRIKPEYKGRVDLHILKGILAKELEEVRDQLLAYKADNKDYDLVLKGRGNCIKEVLELLES